MEETDYYTLLGIAHTAGADEVRAAFHRFARKYHPDLVGGDGTDEEVGQLYRRATEAYRVLSNAFTRKQYDLGLKEGRLRYDPSAKIEQERDKGKLDPKAVPPVARKFVQDALFAIRRKDWAKAHKSLKQAALLAPKDEAIQTHLKSMEQKLSSS